MRRDKQDRTARLMRVALLLSQHARGLGARELAERLGISARTIYRDVEALAEVGVPVRSQDGRFFAQAFVPPLLLTVAEAVTLFLSVRLLVRFTDRYSGYTLSAFEKLAAILPSPLPRHVTSVVGDLLNRPRDERYERVFELLARAWAEGRRLRIWYPHATAGGRVFENERLVAPYFLEPSPSGHGLYLIGADEVTGTIRTFKVERIVKAELTAERFEIPADFDAAARLRHAWGVVDGDLVEVRLRFSGGAARRVRENRWHPSQVERELPDGDLELTVNVGGLLEITPWVMSWGDSVEVLAPAELRHRLIESARAQLARYGNRP